MTFEEERLAAEQSGRPFRTVTNCVTRLQQIVYLTDEEIAEAQAIRAAQEAEAEAARNTPEALRIIADEEERVACKVDSTMLALINQTRAEWASWAQANFPSLTVAERTRMGVICWLLAVAIRRLMR